MRNTFAYGLLLDGDAARAEAISRELMGDKATDEERQVDAWIHIPALLALGEGDQALEEYHRFAAIFPAEPDLTLMDIAVLKERAEKELRIQGLLD
jgi:hypothetical protein